MDRKLFGTSTIGSHPARSAPAVAPHDSPRSADACRSAIGRPILLKLSHDQRVGHAYAQLIAAWKKAFPDGRVKPAALLWMQGESDARVPELAKDYEQHLTNLIASLLRDLDAPQMKAVIAEINPAKVTPVSPFPCVDEVRVTQRAFPAKDPLTICISTDGLTKAKDQVHYDTAGQQGLGQRFAEALLPLLAKDSR